jgi:eukaryotic translation initiation factor 2C
MLLTPQELQSITHAFCFIYAKAIRGISYCAPAYYADRLCDHGRAYLRHWLLNRGAPYKLARGKKEDDTEYKARVLYHIHNNDYWRSLQNAPGLFRYGLPRRNPWHPNLDFTMFYL